MFNKNTSRTLTFDLTDTSGAYLTGKTVTATVSKDGAAFAAAAGTVTEIANGVYAFAGTAADFNCDAFALRFVATGARDVFIHGTTEADYTVARAAFIDAAISSRSTYAGGAVAVASIAADALSAAAFSDAAVTKVQSGLAKPGNAMSLLAAERESLASVIESHLLNDGDGQMLINAIVGAIGNSNVDEAILVAAIRSDIERAGGTLEAIFSDYARRTGDFAEAPTTGEILDAFKGDPEWKTMLAGTNGEFTYDAGNNVLTLKDSGGTVTLATLTVTRNAEGIPIARTSA